MVIYQITTKDGQMPIGDNGSVGEGNQTGKEYDVEKEKAENIYCGCGNNTFKVVYLDYPWAGCYTKITCSKCGEEVILIDDYS